MSFKLKPIQETDVNVMIGTDSCNVTSLSRNYLTCLPLSPQPTTDESHGDIFDVVLFVGYNLSFQIGKLSYELPSDDSVAISGAIFGGVIVCVLLFLVLIAGFIAWKRKSAFKDSPIQQPMKPQNNKSSIKKVPV